jgi:ligand-binding SRPBCC domain-containing protein
VKTHVLAFEQWVSSRRGEVFPFFADARNLEAITPPWLRFEVLTAGPFEMRVGARIDYRLHVRGIPLRWQSEITAWEPPFRFVDEQRRGPYRRWVHTHTFQEQDGGTLCGDAVEYVVPGGRLVNWLFVEAELRRIFAYRREVLERRFSATTRPM